MLINSNFFGKKIQNLTTSRLCFQLFQNHKEPNIWFGFHERSNKEPSLCIWGCGAGGSFIPFDSLQTMGIRIKTGSLIL
jgi:hypothetical protein